jgi:hypothetical protein
MDQRALSVGALDAREGERYFLVVPASAIGVRIFWSPMTVTSEVSSSQPFHFGCSNRPF